MLRIANMPFALRKRMRDFAQEVACLGDTKHKGNEPPVTITDTSVKMAIGGVAETVIDIVEEMVIDCTAEPDNAGELVEPITDNPEMVIDGAAESVTAGLAEPVTDIPDEEMGIDSAAESGTAGGAEPLTDGAAEPTTQFNPAA